ncbi:MAG: arylsulfotransferase family protein [Solirubrobacteraceae bacterium]
MPPTCLTTVYHSVPTLNAQRLCMNAGVRTHGTTTGTYLFVTPGGAGGAGAGIFQDNGDLVWWHRPGTPKDDNLEVVQVHGRPYLALWVGKDSGRVLLYDEHYRLAGSITAAGRFPVRQLDPHEFRITPQGDALLGIDVGVSRTVHGKPETILQYVVQKVSLLQGPRGIRTGRLLFQWRSLRGVPVSQTHWPDPGKGGLYDYFHGNSIAQDSDGNLIVSGRNTWGIYKISVKTGRIMWEVGARGDRRLRRPWCYQHDVVPLGHQRYSVYDDGGVGPGCALGSTQHAARGLIVRVAPARRPATVSVVRSYTHPQPIYDICCGSTRRLADGDVLIGWGQTPAITEFDAAGRVRMDLSLSDWSYRGLRFPWVGKPLTRPAVFAQLTSRGTHVWASWNGSTEVAAWQALAGASRSSLKEVGHPAPKRSFETSIVLDRRYRTVRVRALDADGRVLATSRAVATN